MNGIGLEVIQSDGGPDDISDGIKGTDFVKVDLFDRRAMNFGFGFRDPGKDGQAPLLDGIGQAGAVDEIANLAKGPAVAVRVIVRVVMMGCLARLMMVMGIVSVRLGVIVMMVMAVRVGMVIGSGRSVLGLGFDHLDFKTGDGTAGLA